MGTRTVKSKNAQLNTTTNATRRHSFCHKLCTFVANMGYYLWPAVEGVCYKISISVGEHLLTTPEWSPEVA